MNGKGSIKSEVNGKLIWKYEGFFKNGAKHGEGTYYEPNGDMYCRVTYCKLLGLILKRLTSWKGRITNA